MIFGFQQKKKQKSSQLVLGLATIFVMHVNVALGQIKETPPAPSDEINTVLMHATFLIAGKGKDPTKTTFGTVFFMGIPFQTTLDGAAQSWLPLDMSLTKSGLMTRLKAHPAVPG